MCLLHLHLQLAQLEALPLACAVAMVTCAVGMWSLVGHLQTCSSQPPEHKQKLPRCRAALGHGCEGPAQRCGEEMGAAVPILAGSAWCCLSQPPIAHTQQQWASRAALLERKVEPMPRGLPCTFHLGLSLFQTPCRGFCPKGLEGRCSRAGW